MPTEPSEPIRVFSMDTSHESIETFAVLRANRIAARVAEGGDELCGWLLSSLQRWWQAHEPQLRDHEVAQAFCDAVSASLPHLDRDRMSQALARGLLSDIREGGTQVSAAARGLVTLLGLDPDATLLSLNRDEWESAHRWLSSERPLPAAEHLLALVHQTISLIGDPETQEQQRLDLIDSASAALGEIALDRSSEHDLWHVIADLNQLWASGSEVARLARLMSSTELLAMIVRESETRTDSGS